MRKVRAGRGRLVGEVRSARVIGWTRRSKWVCVGSWERVTGTRVGMKEDGVARPSD